jgi:hypothetical protein
VNPDRLFDYLEGKLLDQERRELEERLLSDAQLRRELDVARRIHAGMRETRSDAQEVLAEMPEETAARGRRLARRVGLAAMVLVAMNVLLGLLYIARHESKNPNRELLEKQSREQLRQALDRAAAAHLTPPPIGVMSVNVAVEEGATENVADQIVNLAKRLGASGTKGLPDRGRVEVLVEIKGNRAGEFTGALRAIEQVKNITGEQTGTGSSDEKVTLMVQVSSAK